MPENTFTDEQIEQYALGGCDVELQQQIEAAAVHDEAFQGRVNEARELVLLIATANSVEPPKTFKVKLDHELALEIERQRQAGRPPMLHKGSKIQDLDRWLLPLEEPQNGENLNVHMIEMMDDRHTAVIWLKDAQPNEVHTDCVERFLILEGTCDVMIGENVNSLVQGDVLTIPMYIGHSIKVTSELRCKVLVQRIMV